MAFFERKSEPKPAREYAMDNKTAEYLTDTFINQLKDFPFDERFSLIEITPERRAHLIRRIGLTQACNHPKRMQFEVPAQIQKLPFMSLQKG